GRVVSVSSIFVSASNEIGAFESGLMAKTFGTIHSVIIGSGFTLILVIIIWARTKELLKVKLI
ncbi:MAG: MFS transporter, partial [Siphonobacter sp.]